MKKTEKEMRELDAFVAEHVMGWRRGRRWGNGNGEWIIDGKGYEHHQMSFDRTPFYTTDPAAAMEVLEKCARKTTNLEIDFRDDGLFGVGIYRGLNKLGAEADTLPLAICKFAQLLWEEKH